MTLGTVNYSLVYECMICTRAFQIGLQHADVTVHGERLLDSFRTLEKRCFWSTGSQHGYLVRLTVAGAEARKQVGYGMYAKLEQIRSGMGDGL